METSGSSVQHQGPLPSTLAIPGMVSGGTPTANVFQQDIGQGEGQHANVSLSVTSFFLFVIFLMKFMHRECTG